MPLLALNSHLGVRRIGDTLTFYAETTSATGLALDADAVPGYRIYEGETGTAIATGGVMALLDSSNTAGLYSEQITLTFSDPPGYEFNKDYVIYLTATISGVAAAAIYTFKIGPEAALYSGVASAGAAGTITLTGTPATNDILNGTTVAILSGTGAGQSRVISDYTSGLVASVIPNWITTPDTTSVFAVYPYGQSNVQQWRDVQPNVLVSNRVDVSVGAMAANVLTATAINADAINATKVADGTIDALTFASGAINAAAIAADAITAAKVAADVATEIRSLASGTSDSGTTTTMVDAARTEADTDYWKGNVIAFTSGNISGQTRLITGFNAATDTITFAPATTQAVATQTYEILPWGRVEVGSLAAGVITTAAFTTGAIDANAIGTGAIDADAIAPDAIGASELAADAATEIGTAVWAAATRTLTSATNITSTGGTIPITAGGLVSSDVTAISTDTAAADSLETMLDGTGGNVLTLAQLRINSAAGGGAIDIDNSAGPAIVATAGGAASHGILIEGAGSGDGFRTVGGATGNGHHAVGGATSGIGFVSEAVGGGHGFRILGVGTGLGASIQGGATAHGVELVGGATGSRVGVSFVPSGNAPPVSGNLGYIRTGTAQAGAATTITLDAGASADDDIYNGNLVFLTAGTGGDQARIITDYDGTTKVATVSPAWTRAPDATSVFSLKVDGMATAGAVPSAADVANAVWDELTTEGRVALSYGQLLKDDIDATISSRASAAQATAIQADTDDIQARLPATLVGGRMRSHVEAFDAAVITAASIAPDAIGASELAADAVAEIQSGLATAAALATVQADTDNIQTRLPAALVGGRMDSSVGALAADVITAASIAPGAIDAATFAAGAIDAAAIADGAIDALTFAAGAINAAAIAADAIGASELAADAVAEIQAGLATAAALATVQADTDDIQARLPAALSGGGFIRAQVYGMEAGTITAAAILTGAIDADALASDAAAEIAGAVWEEPIVNHKVPGTFGQANNAVHSGTAQAGAATTITLAAGASAIDDFYNNAVIFLTTGTGADQIRTITDYNGTTKVATVATWATNPSATTTYVVLPIIGPTAGGAVPTASEVADAVWDELTAEARTVGSYGQLIKDDIDATISSRASAVALAVVQSDTDDIQARLPATLVGGRMRSHIEALDAAVITAASIAPDAIGASELAADAATEIGTAVWAAATRTLTAGAITSATFAAGAIDNAAIAADAIGSSELAATAVAEIADQVWEEAIADHSVTVGSTAEALAAAAAGGSPGAIADAVWDEIASGHVVSGSFGQRLQPIHAGTATAGGATSITLDAGASGSLQFYRGMLVHITGGTGAGQARTITSYSGGTQIATVSPSWVANPASGSVFVITPQNSDATIIAGAVWDEARGSHIGGGTFGEGVNVAPSGIAAASFVAGAIDAAAIATDAIGAAELAASAVTEIQAGLATAAAVAAIQADTDDLQLSAASIQADTNDIQLRLPATLTGAGRMRSHVEAFDPDVINAAAIAPAAIDAATFAAGAIDAAAIGTGAIDADALATDAVAEIADGVWDEDIVAAHGTADTAGETLSQLTKRAATLATEVLDGSIIGQMLDDGTAVYDRTTDSLQAIRDSIAAAGPSAAVIANAVWDELTAEARTVGSYGQLVKDDLDATVSSRASSAQAVSIQADTDDIQARLTTVQADTDDIQVRLTTIQADTDDLQLSAASIQADTNDIQLRLPTTLTGTGRMRSQVEGMDAGTVTATAVATGAIDADALATDAVDEIVDQVWNEALAGHLAVGSTGEALNAASSGGSAPTVAQIADGVWDELIAGHLGAGSTGESLNNAGSGASPAAIADAVWEEAIADHSGTVGSTAEALDGSRDAALSVDVKLTPARAANLDNLDVLVSSRSTLTATQAADQVWDEQLGDHLDAGSTGEALDAITVVAGSTPAQVAVAVWDELKANHQGDTIMGNMAQDLDNLEFSGEEG